ncbi:MAG: RusA family crossover junction endodeoxyribonuclease [Wenzhouxiangella sp.]
MSIYQITPVAKPRMTQRDKWAKRPTVLRYRAFKDHVQAMNLQLPLDGAVVTFVLPMPASWSQRKRRELDGQPHCQKPDLDNLVKALADACFTDDSTIHTMAARKIWGASGAIHIRPWQWGDPWPEPIEAKP